MPGSIFPAPKYGLNAFGIVTDPSFFWWISRSAMTSRASATPEPFNVWTYCAFFILSDGWYLILARLAWKSVNTEQLDTSSHFPVPGAHSSIS